MAPPSACAAPASAGVCAAEFELLAIGPLDGRYAKKVAGLKAAVSEFSLVQKRAFVMSEWLACLATNARVQRQSTADASESPAPFPSLSEEGKAALRQMGRFSMDDVRRVKEVEKTANHDLKAVEYVLKGKLETSEATMPLAALTHFGCTSEDVNNLSWALCFKEATEQHLLPAVDDLAASLHMRAVEFAEVPMLSLTHGQPATPSTFGKEIANFEWRVKNAIKRVRDVEFRGKYNGAVGCFNALVVADANVAWPEVARDFVESLGLAYQPYSTQIEQHDWIAELCDALARLNSILLDFSRDMWLYISRDVLKLRVVAGEVGSSTMPHKVNPIDFENAEGNLELANALLRFLSTKLPVSRMQRDLSDSTVLRNVGVAFGHCLVAYESAKKGLDRVDVHREKMLKELDENWAVLGEPVQTLLRKRGVRNAYEKLKSATRGQDIDKERMQDIVETCSKDLLPEDLEILRSLTPATYTGLAPELAKKVGETMEEEAAKKQKTSR
ncbi:putative adenylosuccinate lyase [Toxoplasma gondii VAND]|uniref:Adenylosuccinate lyase n=1 Tax=Toxoplasma gondii VAND TaxID=933077 RepID=A0A086QCH6_TOXGO|nr:putative adenylosuccinate lyase [Toxoplasma gondii VAND]